MDLIAHGKALLYQYRFIQKYIKNTFGEKYSVVTLSLCDVWDGNDFDTLNAKKLEKYLKRFIDEEDREWYNDNMGESHRDYNWNLLLKLRKFRSNGEWS